MRFITPVFFLMALALSACSSPVEFAVSGMEVTLDAQPGGADPAQLPLQSGQTALGSGDEPSKPPAAGAEKPVAAGNKPEMARPQKPCIVVEAPEAEELQSCRRALGDFKALLVAKESGSTKLREGEALLVKVVGNQNAIDLKLEGEGRIAGVCVYVAGNKNRAKISFKGEIGGIYYAGTGNYSRGEIVFAEGANVAGAFGAKLAGNQSLLSVSGGPCPKASVSRNSLGLNCE